MFGLIADIEYVAEISKTKSGELILKWWGVNNEVEHEADHGVRVKDAMENEDRNVKTAVYIARLKKMFCIIYSKSNSQLFWQ